MNKYSNEESAVLTDALLNWETVCSLCSSINVGSFPVRKGMNNSIMASFCLGYPNFKDYIHTELRREVNTLVGTWRC